MSSSPIRVREGSEQVIKKIKELSHTADELTSKERQHSEFDSSAKSPFTDLNSVILPGEQLRLEPSYPVGIPPGLPTDEYLKVLQVSFS
jgi:hypothetical protein